MPAAIQKFSIKSVRSDVDAEVKAIQKAYRRVSKNSKTAISFLSRAGILTKSGKLAKSYR